MGTFLFGLVYIVQYYKQYFIQNVLFSNKFAQYYKLYPYNRLHSNNLVYTL